MLGNESKTQLQLFSKPALTTLQRRAFLDRFKKDYAYRVIFRPSNLRLEYSKLLAREYQKTMSVIHLDLASLRGSTYEEIEKSYIQYMAEVYKRYYPQVDSYLVNTSEKRAEQRYERVMEGHSHIPDNLLLKELMNVLHKAEKPKKVMVIIDNIDLPVLRVRPEDAEKTQRLFESIYSAALKDNKHLGGGWVTGMLPVYVPNNIVVESNYYHYYHDFFPEDDAKPNVISSDYTAAIEYLLNMIDKSGKHSAALEQMQKLLDGEAVQIMPLEYHGKSSFLDYYDEKDLWRTLYFLGLLKEKNHKTFTSKNQSDNSELVISGQYAKNYIQGIADNWLDSAVAERRSRSQLFKGSE